MGGRVFRLFHFGCTATNTVKNVETTGPTWPERMSCDATSSWPAASCEDVHKKGNSKRLEENGYGHHKSFRQEAGSLQSRSRWSPVAK